MASLELLKEHNDFQEELRDYWGTRMAPADLAKQIVSVELELEKIHRKRKMMAELLLEDGIGPSHFVEVKKTLASRELHLQKELEGWLSYAEENENRLASFEELLEILQNTPLPKIWAEATEEERRLTPHDYIKAIVLHDEYIEVQYYDAPPLKVLWDEVSGRNVCVRVERVMGLEPTTFSLGS